MVATVDQHGKSVHRPSQKGRKDAERRDKASTRTGKMSGLGKV